MKRFFLCCLGLILTPISLVAAPELQKAQTYTGQESISGWVMSEKLDGIRGVWTGKKLLTRKGNPIHAPAWFTQHFPPFALDGELWSRRSDFSFIQSTVMDKTPSDGWRHITYNIFEVPDAPGDFPERLAKAQAWFKNHPNSPARIIDQHPCHGQEALQHFLADIEKQGGEGVIVKDPALPYHTGRSAHVLKVKKAKDMEGTVVAVLPGKGKYEGMMGSLTLTLDDGTRFVLGTGFTDAERKNPPKKGDVITFRYHGLTKNGKPRFASFMRIRKD